MVMGHITINCYKTDFTVGVFHYAVSGVAFGFTFLTSAVTKCRLRNFISIWSNPIFALSNPGRTEVSCCAYCSCSLIYN